jgi:CheY-like chemotaxis protein
MTAELEKRVAELEAENDRLRKAVDAKSKVAARALASFQQRALHMEIIRQQNEDLDRLASDLARSKRVEEERAREIENAARLQGEFVANFSHEIRTPLNGIIGYCDLLARDEGSRLTPYGRRDLNVIKSNARTLLSLINDILDLSKIEAGGVKVQRDHVELEPIVEECVATARERLKGKEVEMVINVSDEARSLYTDELKIRQILLNLLTNAAKFTDLGEIVVHAVAEGRALVLAVEDTGIGIPADQLGSIFEKFRQVDGTSTRKVGGTGLGLTIVRELVRVLGGTIDVQSTLGRGARFTVRLPGVIESGAASEPAASVVPDSRPAESSGGAKPLILVVDDDAMTRELVRGQLEDAGFVVGLASDGVSALRMVKEQRPAAVLLDIHLPKLDGWSVLAEIKSQPELTAIPVVIFSVEEQRARGYSLGACEYLVKPVEPERLIGVVRRALAPGIGEVLIVDDDATTRELIARHLRRAGFATVEAENGEEALARARVARPSLVVLDLVMPDMSGFDVLRELRAAHGDMPVVVLTGKVLEKHEVDTLREGFAHVLQKGDSAIQAVIEQARRVFQERRAPAEPRLPRVLYVEDSAQNRDIVRRYLADGFDVIDAEDGEHGIERARRDDPDLILMDLSLPRIDGWEATRRIKADIRTAWIPVIALTAHAAREDQERAREVGCADYVTKPVEREPLIATIRRNLVPRPAHG